MNDGLLAPQGHNVYVLANLIGRGLTSSRLQSGCVLKFAGTQPYGLHQGGGAVSFNARYLLIIGWRTTRSGCGLFCSALRAGPSSSAYYLRTRSALSASSLDRSRTSTWSDWGGACAQVCVRAEQRTRNRALQAMHPQSMREQETGPASRWMQPRWPDCWPAASHLDDDARPKIRSYTPCL